MSINFKSLKRSLHLRLTVDYLEGFSDSSAARDEQKVKETNEFLYAGTSGCVQKVFVFWLIEK
jgi:hypothetical protein